MFERLPAFALGVWASAEAKRSLRIAGGLLLAYSSLGLAWPFAAMHQREILAAGGETLADTAHLVLAAVTVALMFAAMAFGAAAFGWWFRLYSISTILVLLTFGALTGANASRVAANLPTPWAGLWERINIGAFLLGIVVLALVLLRAQTAYRVRLAVSRQQSMTEDSAVAPIAWFESVDSAPRLSVEEL